MLVCIRNIILIVYYSVLIVVFVFLYWMIDFGKKLWCVVGDILKCL